MTYKRRREKYFQECLYTRLLLCSLCYVKIISAAQTVTSLSSLLVQSLLVNLKCNLIITPKVTCVVTLTFQILPRRCPFSLGFSPCIRVNLDRTICQSCIINTKHSIKVIKRRIPNFTVNCHYFHVLSK